MSGTRVAGGRRGVIGFRRWPQQLRQQWLEAVGPHLVALQGGVKLVAHHAIEKFAQPLMEAVAAISARLGFGERYS